MLIEEHISEFVELTAVPLQLVKSKRQTKAAASRSWSAGWGSGKKRLLA